MLSARAGEEASVEGLDEGADDYLTKPFTARELLSRVASHLKMSRLRLEAAKIEHELRMEVPPLCRVHCGVVGCAVDLTPHATRHSTIADQ
jgi:DNA-binding response OmpR family regulator